MGRIKCNKITVAHRKSINFKNLLCFTAYPKKG